jgi:hypothetical protein
MHPSILYSNTISSSLFVCIEPIVRWADFYFSKNLSQAHPQQIYPGNLNTNYVICKKKKLKYFFNYIFQGQNFVKENRKSLRMNLQFLTWNLQILLVNYYSTTSLCFSVKFRQFSMWNTWFQPIQGLVMKKMTKIDQI